MDMPVVLIQRIVNHLGIVKLHAHAKQEKSRHEQSVRPGLFRKIIVGRHRMLKHMVTEPKGLLLQVMHLAHHHIPIFFIPGCLI